MLNKDTVLAYFLAHPYSYFDVGTCPTCNLGDMSLFGNRSGILRHGSTCKCPGRNVEIPISDPNADPYVADLLDFYMDKENGHTAALKVFIES